jgi:hypothetical protein
MTAPSSVRQNIAVGIVINVVQDLKCLDLAFSSGYMKRLETLIVNCISQYLVLFEIADDAHVASRRRSV